MTELAAMVRGAADGMKRGDFTGLSVLADFLDDRSSPFGPRVRAVYQKYIARAQAWSARDWSRSRKWCKNSALEHAANECRRIAEPMCKRIVAAERAAVRESAKPARDVVGGRATKAAADLARWERKLKVAKAKVAKYRKRVAYYAKRTAAAADT